MAPPKECKRQLEARSKGWRCSRRTWLRRNQIKGRHVGRSAGVTRTECWDQIAQEVVGGRGRKRGLKSSLLVVLLCKGPFWALQPWFKNLEGKALTNGTGVAIPHTSYDQSHEQNALSKSDQPSLL
jgi:hypothetical protein